MASLHLKHLVLIIWIHVTVSRTLPNVWTGKRELLVSREGPLSHDPHTRPETSTIPGDPERALAGLAQKRTPPGLPPLYPAKSFVHRATFTALSAILPTELTSSFLQQFFSSIISRVQRGGEWHGSPEKNEFAIVEGGFQLSFFSIGDTVPWSFVEHTARQLLESAILGFTSLFETTYINDGNTIGVKVALTLVESSSSGSTEDQWREGSVPSVHFPRALQP
ncbi:hypothetical protein ACLMJK_001948 [Lecanora helva]